jgi:ABC-2 type transport system ATP-binding protein
MPAKTTIDISHVVKDFGSHRAVDDVSFSVNAGEVFGLLGPNGAGKTTTIRMLTTLIPPTSGYMFVDGFDVATDGTSVRRRIGYVPQSVSADGALTGYENLLIFAKLLRFSREERDRRIAQVLHDMDLEAAAGDLVSHYSGGMVRRLEIGQAILHRPRVLILDEPTVGLDPIARHSVWQALEELRLQFGMTILVTTHYMEEADAYCQRVAIMHSGRVAALDTPAALKHQVGRPDASLEHVFTAVTGNRLESGGSYRELRQLDRRTRRFA